MQGNWITLSMIPGATIVGDAILWGVTILEVWREGIQYNITSTVAANQRTVRRMLNQTKLEFGDAAVTYEKVYILYKF